MTIFDRYNIIYRKEFKNLNLKLYESIKNFDLNAKGKFTKLDYVYLTDEDWINRTPNKSNYVGWRGLFYRLGHIKGRDALSYNQLMFLKIGDLPINYIFDSISDDSIQAHNDYILYLFYAMAVHPNFNFSLQQPLTNYDLLRSSYDYNLDIYRRTYGAR